MSYLTIHPDYAQALNAAGIQTAEDILRLKSIVFCGHPGRNVSRARLLTSLGELNLLIKREHSVQLKERLDSLASGFGFASKARREALTLSSVRQAGIPAPPWIAHGEDATGCAFLVLLECTGAIDLRAHLRCLTDPATRQAWARRLGRTIAAIHEAGFDHPDLYAKHILVLGADQLCIIDWQRTSVARGVAWTARLRSLALLNATLEASLASLAERRRFLASYVTACRRNNKSMPMRRSLDETSLEHAAKISKRRRLRELVNASGRTTEPGLIWRDGEALCLTAELDERLDTNLPPYLSLKNLPARPATLQLQEDVEIEGVGPAELTRCRRRSWTQPIQRSARSTRRTSPELRLAGIIYRLERLGMPVGKVLAFGQRYSSLWATESFLLQERKPWKSAREWLEASKIARNLPMRRRLIREAALLLGKLHRANFYLRSGVGGASEAIFAVEETFHPRMALDRVQLLISRRREAPDHAESDLRQLWRTASGRQLSRSDRLRFLLAYSGTIGFRQQERELWRRLTRRKPIATMAANLLGLLMTW
jgi:tRNA A-37 threonylcarbamoyl transferase component Bud32